MLKSTRQLWRAVQTRCNSLARRPAKTGIGTTLAVAVVTTLAGSGMNPALAAVIKPQPPAPAVVAAAVAAGPASTKAQPAGPAPAPKMELRATAYGPSLADNFPFKAVDVAGHPLQPGDVAVDPQVIPLGTRLYITGYSSPYLSAGGMLATACDTGDAIVGNRVDIFIEGDRTQVASFGVQKVQVTILGPGGRC